MIHTLSEVYSWKEVHEVHLKMYYTSIMKNKVFEKHTGGCKGRDIT